MADARTIEVCLGDVNGPILGAVTTVNTDMLVVICAGLPVQPHPGEPRLYSIGWITKPFTYARVMMVSRVL